MNGDSRDLKLEAPQQVNMGVALTSKDIMNLLVEADVRWVGWANADGYKDFDWNNQWVYSIGMQVEPISNFFLRAGYTYAENPVENHDGFDGSINFLTMQPNSTKNVQGIIFPTYYYETFRMIGFPAIVEQHVTVGTGYRFNKRFSMNVGYTHALEKSMSETGTDLMGQPVTLESTLSEESIDFGMTWNF
jgi:long-chain fatty acid transport protein